MKHLFQYICLFIIITLSISCQKQKEVIPDEKGLENVVDTLADVKPKAIVYDTTQWTNILDMDESLSLDIRYATTNNFTDKVIYDCPACFLRPETAKALVQVHQNLKKKGYGGIKIFDCYRPKPYQQKLWDIVPDPRFVSPPDKGSYHTRGMAVDLTILGKNGEELDMGTDFDVFTKEAYHDYPLENQSAIENRKILKAEMLKEGFGHIRTEWWHYSHKSVTHPLSEWVWDCPE